MTVRIALLLTAITLGCAATHAETAPPLSKHISMITQENWTANQIIGNELAPNINRLANEYG